MTHGGNQLYRTKVGTLYSGAYQYPVRSTDNGASWSPLSKGLFYSWHMGICGDGEFLYTACSNAKEPFFTTPENDGLTWTPYQGGKQKFAAAPFEMHYDSKNHIVYSASWSEGLLALKVDTIKWHRSKEQARGSARGSSLQSDDAVQKNAIARIEQISLPKTH
jgi:hypothetical protein